MSISIFSHAFDCFSNIHLVFLPGLGEIKAMTERLELSRQLGDGKRFEIITMHSTLSSRDQRRAFMPSKRGSRKIILATNIAETSVTIPDVVCGKFLILSCGSFPAVSLLEYSA